ncbi:MAG: hypothetical protein DRR16_14845 [Candidatus Parabeggiatoa sp. nov. 3]|nr:MAG: hypothetical protein DRR00_00850 [Gammaproteobacteria bacterium]RKZ68333.1 MAG: hypothetical protein DRQ99_04155 [Gammaproteobacteria bacterium]RKZ84381.1 MAG: hypothetical protein DRR16_14845 [Gammaproteobacteria bacterium]HEW97280.1 hypothetical protein [Beggiatoa sp.]
MLQRISAAQAFNKQAEAHRSQQDTGNGDYLDIPAFLSADNNQPDEKASAKKKKKPSTAQAEPSPKLGFSSQLPQTNLVTSEELQLQKEPIKVHETGFWRWKRIIVPPNVYVVHTRIGRDEPVTLGLGKSFRYNPYKDAYLVVPAAMQTIGIVARSITKEKQGINILAYLQWQISDFSIAYKKLDFSDSRDPLGIVNAQLGEQADAAIKDKIATMSVEEVLTDKAPIIEELTTRLKTVTEGRSHEDGLTLHEGLGIKIVTVQIREAFISSSKLWQDLQAPFRHQQERTARISLLTTQNEVHQKELESHRLKEIREAETESAIEEVKQKKQTEAIEFKVTQESIRFTKTQESFQEKIQLEEQTTLTRHASKLRLQAQEQEMAQKLLKLEEETALAKQTSEQRLKTQEARLAHDTQLGALQQEQAKALEQARLDNEADKQQKTLETEQALHALDEENRLNEANMLAEQQRLEQEKEIKQQAAALQLLIQDQDDLLEAKVLEARIVRERQARLAQLELKEANNRLKHAQRENEMVLLRHQQEIRNLINESDLLRRLIDNSADIADKLPDIQELKVLQTGGEMTTDMLSTFIAKILAVAEHLGVPLKPIHSVPPKKNKEK